MNKATKIVGVNLLILLCYSILAFVADSSVGLMALSLLIHVCSMLVASVVCFIDKDKARGKAFLLAAGVVLLIGFSTCLGGVG